uniref:NADH-ubiquinone oxidoreductase chain 1 n=1 Tax=Symphylella sp. YG-2006 TaxID=390856 RepID=B7S772_9MYRI|nr:NADH dehydrogenase subunit 1 [Symphylella sp. YG-2006]ABQ01741.1 NADH dehydrogenase subunit 1 [Symphylella sp. YG-2006]
MLGFVVMMMEILGVILGVLISVAFFTLFERKVLGYVQLRKGPNKVGVMGVFQPFSDAFKLFTKESVMIFTFDFLYYFCPVFSLGVMLIGYLLITWDGSFCDFVYGILYFFAVLGLGVYSIFGSGWASNSKYALLGGMRSVAQTISYEVVFSLVLLIYLVFLGSYDFGEFHYYSIFYFFYFPVFLCWIICLLAELNRTPFDFAEGESELVSGFNIEYSGFGFAFIFMAEYGYIIFLSLITGIIFFGGMMLFFGFVTMGFILVVRGSYPRYRYDKLMYLAWKGMLPVILNYYFLVGGILILSMIFF